ncbi:MAG: ethanolamine utilization protein EutN [Rhodothermales bacterium]|nr:ethanolamine utilization protein EutN [Rhodothermales bacterium]
MFLCKVTGTVTSSHKDARFVASKLLVVQPVDKDGETNDEPDMLALDRGLDAGIGDYVLVAREGAAVKQIYGDVEMPANVIILAVVDAWSIDINE